MKLSQQPFSKELPVSMKVVVLAAHATGKPFRHSKLLPDNASTAAGGMSSSSAIDGVV